MRPPPTQYATEDNLAARQRLWAISRYEPAFSLYPWVLGLAGLRGGEAVLEVGCGNGSYLELVEAVGLDVSPGMVAVCARSASRMPARDVPVAASPCAVIPLRGGARRWGCRGRRGYRLPMPAPPTAGL